MNRENRIEKLRRFIDEILHVANAENRRIGFLHLYGVAQLSPFAEAKT